jgi:hypothetical protein
LQLRTWKTLQLRSQLLVTVAHVKTFFGYSKDKKEELIELTEALSGAHKEETSEDMQEVKLDEVWGLTAAEDVSTECLADNKEENDGVMSKQILVDG